MCRDVDSLREQLMDFYGSELGRDFPSAVTDLGEVACADADAVLEMAAEIGIDADDF